MKRSPAPHPPQAVAAAAEEEEEEEESDEEEQEQPEKGGLGSFFTIGGSRAQQVRVCVCVCERDCGAVGAARGPRTRVGGPPLP